MAGDGQVSRAEGSFDIYRIWGNYNVNYCRLQFAWGVVQKNIICKYVSRGRYLDYGWFRPGPSSRIFSSRSFESDIFIPVLRAGYFSFSPSSRTFAFWSVFLLAFGTASASDISRNRRRAETPNGGCGCRATKWFNSNLRNWKPPAVIRMKAHASSARIRGNTPAKNERVHRLLNTDVSTFRKAHGRVKCAENIRRATLSVAVVVVRPRKWAPFRGEKIATCRFEFAARIANFLPNSKWHWWCVM